MDLLARSKQHEQSHIAHSQGSQMDFLTGTIECSLLIFFILCTKIYITTWNIKN